MSKRAGTVVNLEDLVEAIGVDAARYALARASVDQQIDIDLDLWTPADQRQPGLLRAVRARPHRLGAAQRRRPRPAPSARPPTSTCRSSRTQRETDLLRAIGEFPRVVTSAAELRAPHRVARYLEELAGTYHRFYDSCRVLPRGDEEPTPLTTARLWLCAATAVGAAQRPRRARRERPGADVRAHPAGPLHGNIAAADGGRRAAGRPRRARPAGLAALGPPGRRRAAPRRPRRHRARPRARHPAVRARRGRLPRPRRGLRRPPSTGADVHYASKAFLCGQVARWIAEDGLHLDACSGNELALALAAGFPAERIALHGNNKSLGELRWPSTPASGTSSSTPSTRSTGWCPLAAARVAAGGAPGPVLIRATVGIEAHTHEFIATAHEDQKFGFSLATGDALTAAVRVIREPALQLAGLHSHIGSQIFDTAGFEAAAHRVVGLLGAVRAGHRRGAGGAQPRRRLRHRLPVRGRPGQPRRRRRPGCARSSPPSAPSWACRCRGWPSSRAARSPAPAPSPSTRSAPSSRCGSAPAAPRARPLVRNYVSVDGGMSDNIRTALYDADYTCVLASRTSDAPPALCRVVGKHCESGDILVRDLWLPVRRRRRATCSRSPPPAPTAGRWPATTTTCSSPRWSPSATACDGDRPAADTGRRVRPRRRPRRRARTLAGDRPAGARARRGSALVSRSR